MTHTKGKWEIKNIGNPSNGKIEIRRDAGMSHPSKICTMPTLSDESYANAKRIVQMNNSFDGLLEAVRAVREYFQSVEPDKLTCSEREIHWVGIDNKCRTAIAQAESDNT